ncbi:MAG: hypothetical protein PHE55_20275 [Methylococcaceae bacterium]|nr:hypothetical protein [Methylococcaceae bacterium]
MDLNSLQETKNIVIFLEAIWDEYTEKTRNGRVVSNNWDFEIDEDDPTQNEVSIGFMVQYIHAIINTNHLWIGISICEDITHPFTITSYYEEVFNRLQQEFQHDNFFIDEDNWIIQFPWPVPDNASYEEIRAAGQNTANRIMGALENIE